MQLEASDLHQHPQKQQADTWYLGMEDKSYAHNTTWEVLFPENET